MRPALILASLIALAVAPAANANGHRVANNFAAPRHHNGAFVAAPRHVVRQPQRAPRHAPRRGPLRRLLGR